MAYDIFHIAERTWAYNSNGCREVAHTLGVLPIATSEARVRNTL